MLKVAPRRGFIVVSLTSKDILDGAQAQALLAGELCARAASLATESDISALHAIQTRLEHAAAIGDLAAVEELDARFHLTIYRIADAPAIYRLVQAAAARTPRAFSSAVGGWPAAATRDHQAIVKALRDSDGKAARKAMADESGRIGRLLARHLFTGRS